MRSVIRKTLLRQRRSVAEEVAKRPLSSAVAQGSCFCELDTRGVLELSGADSKAFLQGLITNNVNELEAEKGGMYAAFLNAKGRMVTDVILHRVAKDTFFLDLHKDYIPRLLKYLKLAKLRKDVSILDASDTYSITSVMSPSLESLQPHEAAFAENPLGIAFKDPRFDQLGYRVICSRKEMESLSDKLSRIGLKPVTSQVYEKFRMLHGIAEGNEAEGVIPLEFNLDLLNGVSFTKGCYTGQELTARTHFQGLVRKRLVPVVLETSKSDVQPDPVELSLFGSQDLLRPAQLSDDIELPASVEQQGKPKSAGKLVALAKDSSLGLAHLRLEEGYETTWTTPGAFSVAGTALHVHHFPDWWYRTIEK